MQLGFLKLSKNKNKKYIILDTNKLSEIEINQLIKIRLTNTYNMYDNNLIGHKNILLELKNLYKLKKLPNKLLLSGFGGIGKRIVVNELLNFIYDGENSSTLIYKKLIQIFFLKKKKIVK